MSHPTDPTLAPRPTGMLAVVGWIEAISAADASFVSPRCIEIAHRLWGVYQMLGKRCPAVYALTK